MNVSIVPFRRIVRFLWLALRWPLVVVLLGGVTPYWLGHWSEMVFDTTSHSALYKWGDGLFTAAVLTIAAMALTVLGMAVGICFVVCKDHLEDFWRRSQ